MPRREDLPPRRKFMETRVALPPSKGARPQTIPPPNLRPVEMTLFQLLSRPGVWFLVDEYIGETSTTSAMRNALWRRGVETRIRKSHLDGRVVQVWARWTHPVPDTVGPWEM